MMIKFPYEPARQGLLFRLRDLWPANGIVADRADFRPGYAAHRASGPSLLGVDLPFRRPPVDREIIPARKSPGQISIDVNIGPPMARPVSQDSHGVSRRRGGASGCT